MGELNSVLMLGANGQIGRALRYLLGSRGIYLTRHQLDLSKPESIVSVLDTYQPKVIINAAAYTQVDQAEKEEALATAVNGDAVKVLSEYCAQKNIPLVHYSTDYVFAGTGTIPFTELDTVSPLNAYGRSKLAGERHIVESGCKYLIFRTSWVYDDVGKNFLTTMLRLGSEREEVRVVNDQHGAPSYALHLAQATLQVLQKATGTLAFPSGIFHMCNSGETSWFNFAVTIFDAAKRQGMARMLRSVKPIPTEQYPTPAQRPLNSRLDCTKLERVFGITLPHWEEGLRQCLENQRAHTGLSA